MKLSELAKTLGGNLVGSQSDFDVTGISTLTEASPGEISFVTDKKFLRDLSKSQASAVLISEKLAPVDMPHITFPDVWAGTLNALKIFHPGFARKTYEGIHPTAVIHPTAILAHNVTIGPLAIIGPNVTIGIGTYIAPGVVISEHCKVGENCIIYANAVLETGTVLGNGVHIQPGAVLGADGFKYELIKGRWTKIPQVGHVELGDDAEVGANTCIDRASYTVTEIGENTKIDNLVQIGHNVHIGQNCVIVAQSGIAGSTTIGNNSILAAQAGIADNLHIGNNVVILAQSGCKDNTPDGQVLLGSPAVPFRQRARAIALEAKLPDMAAELKRLTKKVEELEQRLAQPEADK